MLGSIIALSAGEVSGLLADQERSVFTLGAGVVRFDAVPSSASTDDLADLQDELYQSLRASSTTIVFDAHGNDGPRLGVFDTAGTFDSLELGTGRVLAKQDYLSRDLRVMVRSDSYIAERLADSGESAILPEGATVTGTFVAPSAPFASDYVYNLFSLARFDGSFYISASEPEVADDFARILRSAGISLTPTPLPGPIDYVQSTRGAIEIELMAALLVVSLGLVFFDTATSQRNRWRVSQLFGATAARIGWEEALRSSLAIGAGLALGAGLTRLAVGVWAPSLAAPAWVIVLIVIATTLLAGLLAAPIHFLASRSTGLVR